MYLQFLGVLSTTEQFGDRLLGCSLEEFFKLRAMCLLLKVFWTESSPYLREIFRYSRSDRTGNLLVPLRCTALRKSLFGRGVTDWNRLPITLRSVNSYERFKLHCLQFIRNHWKLVVIVEHNLLIQAIFQ